MNLYLSNLSMKFLVVGIFILFMANEVSGQCCAAGNPVGGDGTQDGVKKHQMRVFAAYRLSYSRDYFNGDSKEDVRHIEKSFYNYSSLSLTYGVNWRLTLHGEMGYFFNKVQDVNLSEGQERISASGAGDLALSGRYDLLKKKLVNENQLVVSLGGRLPVGAFSEEQDGVVIPISLQPSSGALKINSGLFYSHKKKDFPVGWSSYLFIEWSNTIEKDFLVYKYGNLYLAEVSAFYSKNQKFVGVLSGKVEVREKDERENQQEIDATGSWVFYLKPQLQVGLAKTLQLITFAEVPVYKYTNGSQLTNLFSFQVGIRNAFSL